MTLQNSKYKDIQYYMYSDKILIKNGNSESYIELPQVDKAICFYDMYYVKECLYVIVATRGTYDIRYILDEKKFRLLSEQQSK